MKKIIATGILGSLLMGSSITFANFDNYVPKTKNIPTNGILSVTVCNVSDTKNASKELLSECNGEYIESVATGTLISEEDMKKMEKMTPKEQMEYLDKKYPSKLPNNLGKLESSGVIEVSADGKVVEGVIPSESDVSIEKTIGPKDGILISEEDMKKMEKMTPKEQMEYLDKKYPSKLPDNLGKLESSGAVKASSNDVTGMIEQLDAFYESKVLSLSPEKQTKVLEKMKNKLQAKVKSSSSKKKAKAYQNILSHIDTNWSKK